MYIAVLVTQENVEKYLAASPKITAQAFDIANYRGFTDFVSRTKIIYSFQMLVVDLNGMEISESDLLKGIKIHKQYCNTKLAFVFSNSDHPLYTVIQSIGEIGMIADSIEDIECELLAYASGERSQVSELALSASLTAQEMARSLTQPVIKVPNGKKLKICVAGTGSRVGTTTVALSLVSALIKSSVYACYVDHSMRHIKMFKTPLYEYEETEDGMVMRGVPMIASIKGEFDIAVHDCQTDVSQLDACDIGVLVSTSQLYELPNIAAVRSRLSKAQIVFNLAGAEARQKIPNLTDLTDIYFFPFVDSLFEQDNNNLCLWLKSLIEV